jgi:tetratricopeptide (TPR) repeat protein
MRLEDRGQGAPDNFTQQINAVKALIVCALTLAQVDLCPAAQEGGSTDGDVALAYGVKAYNHGDLEAATRLFLEAVKADPEDGTAYYWLARSQLRIGDARGAAANIETSLKAKRPPGIEQARLLTELGAAQLQAGNPMAAEKSLSESLILRSGDATALYLRGIAVAALGKTRKGRVEAEKGRKLDPSLPPLPEQAVVSGTGELLSGSALPLWEVRLTTDYGYDSNPGSFQNGLRAFDPEHPAQRIDGEDGVATGNLRLEVHPFYDKSGWSLGLRTDAYRSWHNDLDLFDLGRWAGIVQLAWGGDPLGYLTGPMGYTRVPQRDSRVSLLFQGGTAYSSLDEEGLSRTHEGAASVTIREGRLTATQIDLDYQDITFFGHDQFSSAEDLSGYEAYLRASQYFYLGRRDRHLRVSALVGESNRDDSTFDSSFLGGGIELSSPLYRRLYLHVAGNWRRDHFDERFDGGGHDETLINATSALVWSCTDHLYLTARGSFLDREVDPETLDSTIGFDRTLGSLGVTFYY